MKPLGPLYTEPTPPSYLVSLLVYEGAFTFLALFGASLLLSVAQYFKGNDLVEQGIAWVMLAGVVGYVFLMAPLAHKASRLRSQHGWGHEEALRFALMEWRFALASLPVIGFLFAPSLPDRKGPKGTGTTVTPPTERDQCQERPWPSHSAKQPGRPCRPDGRLPRVLWISMAAVGLLALIRGYTRRELKVPPTVRSGNAVDVLQYVYSDIEGMVRPGARSVDIDRRVEMVLKEVGATGYFKGYRTYPTVTTASANDEVLMTVPSRRKLVDGDLLKLQIGVKYKDRYAYMGWTFPVGQIASEDQKLMAAACSALAAAAARLRPGVAVSELSQAMDSALQREGFLANRDYVGYRMGEAARMPPEIPCFYDPKVPPAGVIERGWTVALIVIAHAGNPVLEVAGDGWNVRAVDGTRSAMITGMYQVTADGAVPLTKPVAPDPEGQSRRVD